MGVYLFLLIIISSKIEKPLFASSVDKECGIHLFVELGYHCRVRFTSFTKEVVNG